MFYAFSYTPAITDTEADPKILDMSLTSGIIHQVDILFQDGCNHEIFVQIFDDNFQLWPSNRDEKLRANASVISFREFYELIPGSNRLKAKIWTSLTADFKEIVIQIGLLPKRVIQPLSFKELLAAATGLE